MKDSTRRSVSTSCTIIIRKLPSSVSCGLMTTDVNGWKPFFNVVRQSLFFLITFFSFKNYLRLVLGLACAKFHCFIDAISFFLPFLNQVAYLFFYQLFFCWLETVPYMFKLGNFSWLLNLYPLSEIVFAQYKITVVSLRLFPN